MPKKTFPLLPIFLSFFFFFTAISFAQLVSPYNLHFELGHEGSAAYGWTLGANALEFGYVAEVSEVSPAGGLACAKIVNTNKKSLPKDTVGSFFQRIDAKYYLNKTIRFSAFVKTGEIETGLTQQKDGQTGPAGFVSTAPVRLFMNAKNKNGTNIAENSSLNADKRGWNLYFIDINVPPSTDDITFGISFSDTNDVYIDNCSIEIISNDSLYYTSASPLTISELMYLVPLASLTGQIQYFHPSKNASEADWSKVLLNAMAQMKNINEKYKQVVDSAGVITSLNQTILDSLKTFFAPYCPPLELANTPPKTTNFSFPKHTHLLAWFHNGVPNNTANPLTNSSIIDLNSSIKYSDGVAVQYVQMNEQAGKELLLRVKTKFTKYHKGATASISIRFENIMGEYISFIKKELTDAHDWTLQELVGKIPTKATRGLLIFSLKGYGKCNFDDVNLHYKDGNSSIPFIVENADFEKNLPFAQGNWLTTNETYSDGYNLIYDTKNSAKGKQSLALTTDSLSVPILPNADSNIISITTNHILNNDFVTRLFSNSSDVIRNIKPIFAALPRFVPAEIFVDTTIKPNDTLFMQSQITHYETYPIAISHVTKRTSKPDNFNLTWKDRDSRLIFIINLYNIAKMFNALEAVSNDVNWRAADSLLVVNLVRSAECDNKQQFLRIINDMLQVFDDARTRAWIHNDDAVTYSIPINWELLDNKLYVTQVEKQYQNYIPQGAEITKINGKSISDLIGSDSTTPEWKKYFNLIKIKLGKLHNKIDVEITHNGSTTAMPLAYNTLPSKLVYRAVDYWQQINDSIVYIDLAAYSDKDINDAFDSLKKYKHWIFDIRNETQASEIIISLYAKKAYQTTQTILPYWTSDKIQGTAATRFMPPSQNKHIEGKVVFLTNWKTYGWGELLAASAKQQKDALLIGGRTQGAAISSVAIQLDEEFSVAIPTELGFTPAGDSMYNNPVQPDVVVQPTSANIHQDYILEAAINYLTK